MRHSCHLASYRKLYLRWIKIHWQRGLVREYYWDFLCWVENLYILFWAPCLINQTNSRTMEQKADTLWKVPIVFHCAFSSHELLALWFLVCHKLHKLVHIFSSPFIFTWLLLLLSFSGINLQKWRVLTAPDMHYACVMHSCIIIYDFNFKQPNYVYICLHDQTLLCTCVYFNLENNSCQRLHFVRL